MKERPILFSTPMVQAIMNGYKTQTRRAIKPQPENPHVIGASPIWGIGIPTGLKEMKKSLMKEKYNPTRNDPWNYYGIYCATNEDGKRVDRYISCPQGKKDDVLWVRETWFDDGEGYMYKACKNPSKSSDYLAKNLKWKPSIFMPREACRLRLMINHIRCEKLLDITWEDAMSEGVEFDEKEKVYHIDRKYATEHPIHTFRKLWIDINGEDAWYHNPYVWVISFSVI